LRSTNRPPRAYRKEGGIAHEVIRSKFSQLVEGLDGIYRIPYGCFEQTSSTTYPNVLALDYLKRTQKNLPAIQSKARHYIHLRYQRLVGFDVSGGGFGPNVVVHENASFPANSQNRRTNFGEDEDCFLSAFQRSPRFNHSA